MKMRQGIVGGLLVVGGVILSPFGPQVLGWLMAPILSVLSSGNYAWALWTHGGSDTFLWFFLGALWGILLVWAAIFLFCAAILAMKAVGVFALNQTRNTGIDFDEIVSCLGYSCVSFIPSIIFLYFAKLVDVGMGAWATHSSVFAENTYKTLFFCGVKGYLYVYPLSMVVAGLYILKESCRKWGQMLRG